jgi:hypothetical protein
LAPHLTKLDETWHGGGLRPKSKPADFEGNPLPPDFIRVRNFRVNGHTVTYEGKGAMAFRVQDGALTAFAGGNSREITVDGRRTVFADQPLEQIGWAPVAESRRVPNGAVLQVMARGSGGIHIPGPAISGPVSLVAEGKSPGSRGVDIPARFEHGVLHFTLEPDWNGRWIYAVPRPASE